MSQLTIDQIITKAENLEEFITLLIQQFEEETTTSVDSIDVLKDQTRTMSGGVSWSVSARVNIAIRHRNHA